MCINSNRHPAAPPPRLPAAPPPKDERALQGLGTGVNAFGDLAVMRWPLGGLLSADAMPLWSARPPEVYGMTKMDGSEPEIIAGLAAVAAPVDDASR